MCTLWKNSSPSSIIVFQNNNSFIIHANSECMDGQTIRSASKIQLETVRIKDELNTHIKSHSYRDVIQPLRAKMPEVLFALKVCASSFATLS